MQMSVSLKCKAQSKYYKIYKSLFCLTEYYFSQQKLVTYSLKSTQ